MTRVAVLGPGGVGGFVAAALARSGVATTVVARERTAAVIADRGLEVTSARLGEFVARPAASARLDDDPDVLVVATKAPALEAALERVTGEPRLIVPLLNGIDHLALLRERYGHRAVAGTVRVGSDRPEPGVIVQTSPTIMIELASDHPAPRPRMAAFVDVLRTAEIPARLGDTEARVLWSKLARLNALACVTAAYGTTIGPIREHPRKRVEIEDAVVETVGVANAEGAGVDAGDTLREIWDMAPGHTSSLQRDVDAGRPSELDAIPGAVLRHAARHGLECPAIESLVERIRARVDHLP
jgi:2-dehydropantoate 2-reductase